jgi:hypothetical protein
MSPAVARTTLHDVLSMSAGFASLGNDTALGAVTPWTGACAT